MLINVSVKVTCLSSRIPEAGGREGKGQSAVAKEALICADNAKSITVCAHLSILRLEDVFHIRCFPLHSFFSGVERHGQHR